VIRNFKLNKNPNLSGYYSVRSTNKLETIWEYLGRFKSSGYTEKILKNQISVHADLVKKKAEQIAYAIGQAEQYLKSAREGDISIKPLLIYYGIVGLAKVLIISGDNPYLLNSQELSSHGASWKADISNPSEDKIRESLNLMDEFCRIKNSGLYPLFRDCYCTTPIQNNSKISLKELISMIGENWKRYYDKYKTPPNVYRCSGAKNGDVHSFGDNKQIIGNFDDYFQFFHKRGKKEQVEDTLKRIFPELATLYTKSGDRNYVSNNDITSADSHIVISETQTLDHFALIQPFSNFKLTDFDIYFLVFFILGNLCRYRQDKWYKITHRLDKKDEFFLIENLFDIIQFKFPLLILKELEQKDYSFIGEIATWG